MKPCVYRSLRIYSGLPSSRPATALAVVGETVQAVGTDEEVRAVTGPGVDLVDLEGACVLPGFNDAHAHVESYARSLTSVNLRGAASLGEALTMTARHVHGLAEGEWLLGGRWDSNTWQVPVQPTRAALDSVCPDRPAALSSIDGHTIWANSRALALMGIDDTTPDPSGGQIVRDAAGSATGILREMGSAVRSASSAAPGSNGSSSVRDRLALAQQHLLSVGVTSVHDFGSEASRTAYLELLADDELMIRVHHGIPADSLDQAIDEGRATGRGDDWFRDGPVKLFMDGALGSFTALMTEPLMGHPDDGLVVTPFDEVVARVRAATAAGIAVATHAIGDRAVELVIDAYTRAGQCSDRQLRHRIEHNQHVQRRDLTRMASLGVVASMQPVHCTSDIALTESLIGDRDVCSYAWRSLLNSGVPLAFGSDAPVEEPDPFAGLAAATTRARADGTPDGGWQPQERLGLAEALTAYTRGSAYAAGEERRKGVLAPGYLADFVAVDRDPFMESAASLSRSSALTTIVGGQIRWSRPDA